MNRPADSAIICPSLLAADFAALGAESKKVLDFGANWLHVDVMDFHFVPNLSFGMPAITSLRKFLGPDPILDCHLMIENPVKWLEATKKAGASRVTLHIEALEHPQQAIDHARSLGLPIGFALKPNTAVDTIVPYIDQLDMVLVMTVEPGFGGQSFMSNQMEKVRFLRKNYPKLQIQVDGGLTVETTKIAAEAGANVIVAGSSIFGATDPKAVIQQMKDLVECHIAK